MATTRLTDVFLPEIYGTYGDLPDATLMAILNSGMLRTGADLNAFAEGPSQVFTIPYWNDLDRTKEPNASTDDPDDIAVPDKITSSLWFARKAELNNSWSTMDLTRELALSDPLPAIRRKTSAWWNYQKQRRLLAIALGVMNESILNHGGDMVVDISAADATAPASVTDANKFNHDAWLDAVFGMGDRYDSVVAVAAHSQTYKNMRKQGLVNEEQLGDARLKYGTYDGKVIIVDDSMPVFTTTGGAKEYVTIAFAGGAIGYGEGTPTVAEEVERDGQRGNGGGMEWLIERKTWLMHPAGYSWNETASGAVAMAEGQPMVANLQDGKRWTRVVDRKLVPMAFLRHNN